MTQRLLRLFGICLVYVLLNPSFGFGQGVDLVPNLVARPASQFSIVVDSTNGHLLLRFGATNWNNGLGPLELVAGAGTTSGQDVYQRLYRSDGTYTDIWAGTFVWHPAHDHFLVWMFAVSPSHQRRGLGRQLMQRALAKADSDRVPAYLWTGNPENLPYYRSHGFVVVGEAEILGGVPNWFLERRAG